MGQFSVSDLAFKDISDFQDYLISENGQSVANRFEDSIFHTFQILADFPEIGKSRSEFFNGLYSYPNTKYKRTIFYLKISNGVRIVAVLGSYQDHKRHIDDRFLGE